VSSTRYGESLDTGASSRSWRSAAPGFRLFARRARSAGTTERLWCGTRPRCRHTRPSCYKGGRP